MYKQLFTAYGETSIVVGPLVVSQSSIVLICYNVSTWWWKDKRPNKPRTPSHKQTDTFIAPPDLIPCLIKYDILLVYNAIR